MASALGPLVRYICSRGLDINPTKHISEVLRVWPRHARTFPSKQRTNYFISHLPPPRRKLNAEKDFQVLETTCLLNNVLTYTSSDMEGELSAWPRVEKVLHYIKAKTSKEIEWVIKNLTNKNPRPDGFTGELHQTVKSNTNHFQTSPKTEKEAILSNSFYEARITLIPKSRKTIQEKKTTTEQYSL